MMPPKMDVINVFDLEATCWDEDPPDGEFSEVIEFGICVLDLKTLEIRDKASYLIQPKYSGISNFCTELTGITSEMLKGKPDFPSSIGEIVKRYGRNKHWAAWGDYDLNMINDACALYQMPPLITGHYLNIRTVAGLALGITKTPGLLRAMERLGMEFEGDQHRGDDDAYNTARVLRELTLRMRDGR